MDFFQAQDSARRRSKRLVLYFAAAVASIVSVLYAVAILFDFKLRQMNDEAFGLQWWQPDIFAYVAAGSLGIIFFGSLFKTIALRGGGGVVARSVGGVQIKPDTRNTDERRLLNIVEEMALASGVRVPEVYLIPEPGINAFAAGYTPDDAAVAVTQGALDNLSRDELQGVVAHEFSHILNGDMRLNIRLIGLLFGILLIAIIGRGLLQTLRFSRGSSSRGKGSGNLFVVIIAAGVALLVIGYVGVFFGRLIQAAVSRQREFLADASAVQFTRNPDGISGALKRIGSISAGSRIANAHATETSHLFFANALRGSALNLFATHPPLADRIRAIDPSFDGAFKPVPAHRGSTRDTPAAAARATPRPRGAATPPALRPEQFITAIAAAASASQEAGAAMVATLPAELRAAAHDPGRARPLVLALLATPGDPRVEARQREAIERSFPQEEIAALGTLLPSARALPAASRLPLVDLALPTLRTLPPAQIDAFITAMDAFIGADDTVTLTEFALRQVINRYLRPTTANRQHATNSITSYQPFVEDVSLVLSAIAISGSDNPVAVQRAFDAGAAQLGLIRDRLRLRLHSDLQPGALNKALTAIECAALPIKKSLLTAMARSASADGLLQASELETLRAVAAAIDCPAPPISG